MNSRVLFVVCGILAGCGTQVEQSVARWRLSVEQGVPPGATRAQAEGWAERSGVKLVYSPRERKLQSVAERIPVTGPERLVCSEWVVLVTVQLAPSSEVVERSDVSRTGVCL